MSSNSILLSEEHSWQLLLIIFCISFVMLVVRSIVQRFLCVINSTSSPRNLEHSNPDHHHHSLQFQEHELELCVMPSVAMSQFKKEGEGGEEKPRNTECVICLGEFEEGEWAKKLPNCNHIFHVSCIDIWFLSHSNCPLCRSTVHGNLTFNAEIPIMLETTSHFHLALRQQTSSSN